MTLPRLAALAVAALLLAPVAGLAHPPPRTPNREIVRLQGHRRAAGTAAAGEMTLVALGAEHPFTATDRQAFSLAEGDAAKPADRYALQGPRDLLARFAAARPDQTVTILAEHRPGTPNLFLLALDLCPPR
ncbi:MAG: hypothetical protein U0807_13685 [Candidatus Binatia bacterium]